MTISITFQTAWPYGLLRTLTLVLTLFKIFIFWFFRFECIWSWVTTVISSHIKIIIIRLIGYGETRMFTCRFECKEKKDSSVFIACSNEILSRLFGNSVYVYIIKKKNNGSVDLFIVGTGTLVEHNTRLSHNIHICIYVCVYVVCLCIYACELVDRNHPNPHLHVLISNLTTSLPDIWHGKTIFIWILFVCLLLDGQYAYNTSSLNFIRSRCHQFPKSSNQVRSPAVS